MLFNSLDFLLFFPIVVLIYYIIPNRIKNVWLLIASYYFYMCWNAKYIILIFISTAITYISGLLIEYSRTDIRKKIVVAVSFISNLSILFYFKYIDFAANIFTSILNKAGIFVNVPAFDVLLPVGISFYTFQALSYTMDVYRKDVYAEKSFLKYALFVSFFPQLVAGPIERSKNLLRQITVPKQFKYENLIEGVLLMIWGYFLKIVIADRIALFVDCVYNDFEKYQGMYLVVATILFAIQIYCDFSGYSIIAMGAARILGIELMENFYAPYFATSVADFWRRWHISLTSWFKDYLYIPLGGSRKGKVRKYFNKIFVFLVSGLWHGADLSFVIWGGLNGIYQVVGEIMQPIFNRIDIVFSFNRKSIGSKIFHILCTFIFVDFAWIFFRANDMSDAIKIIASMFSVKNIYVLFDGSLYNCGLDEKNFELMLIGILVLLVADFVKIKGIAIRHVLIRQDTWFRCIMIAMSVLFLLLFGKYGPSYNAGNFIYFQF